MEDVGGVNPHSTPEAESAARHMILVTEVGSTVHGCGVGGQDDLDLMGICVEPPEHVVGLRPFEQFIKRTKADGTPQAEGGRSGPGDTDLVVYSLRKWVRLALGGNPSVLLPLFVPGRNILTADPHGFDLRDMASHFASKAAGRAFLGYMRQQRERLTGERGGKHTNRPELIVKYGYDTKYAYHVLRLGFQGCEFMETGRITVPIPEDTRRYLLDVREGKVPEGEVLEQARVYEHRMRYLFDVSGLPWRADPAPVEAWMIGVYRDVWGWK